MFIFPPGEGGAQAYYNNLVGELLSERLVLFNNYFLQPGSHLYDSYEFLATIYKSHLQSIQEKGPYVLVGWSSGGILALEVARQLQLEGHHVSRLVLIDSCLNYKKAVMHGMKKEEIVVGMGALTYQYMPNRFTLMNTEVILIKCTQVELDVRATDYYQHTHDNHLSDYLTNEIKVIPVDATHSNWVKNKDVIQKIASCVTGQVQEVFVDDVSKEEYA